jgi:hypothetical protein
MGADLLMERLSRGAERRLRRRPATSDPLRVFAPRLVLERQAQIIRQQLAFDNTNDALGAVDLGNTSAPRDARRGRAMDHGRRQRPTLTALWTR